MTSQIETGGKSHEFKVLLFCDVCGDNYLYRFYCACNYPSSRIEEFGPGDCVDTPKLFYFCKNCNTLKDSVPKEEASILELPEEEDCSCDELFCPCENLFCRCDQSEFTSGIEITISA